MKKRSIHQLLVIIKKVLLESRSPHDPQKTLLIGLCNTINYLHRENIINLDELESFNNYLYNNRPKNNRRSAWFWQQFLIKPRLYWLTRHINLTK